MAIRYATPSTTQAEVQAWLSALDHVVLSSGSQYDLIVDHAANYGLGWNVPAGAVLELNGAVVNFAGVVNQTAPGSGAAAVGCQSGPGGVICNGIVRAPDNRIVPGQVAQHSNALMRFRAVGVVSGAVAEDIQLLNGPNQALQLNDVSGMTLRRIVTPRPAGPPSASGVYLGHYVDLDVTARGRHTEDVRIEQCDFDAFGQDCFKLENCRRIRFEGVRFRSYVSLAQDPLDPYSSIDEIEFGFDCVFESYVLLSHLRRQWNGSGYDNLGGGRVTLRGRMVGNDALILGGLRSPAVGGTHDEQFANLRAESMSFEGANSHLVPRPDTSWMWGCVGVKPQVTVFARPTSSPHYPFPVTPCVVAGNVGSNTHLTGAVQNSLNPSFVGPYFLDVRGVRVSIAPGTWTGLKNLKGWPSLNVNVPVDFVGEGGSSGTVIDAEDSINPCLTIAGTNNRRMRFFGLTLRRSKAGSSSRGWLVNHAAAHVEFHDVRSVDCQCLNGGGGGRGQAYSRLVLGPGTEAVNCQASGTTNGGGFLIDASGSGSCEVEGVRVTGCFAGGVGGGLRISTPNCRVRSLELIGNGAGAGPGGLACFVSSGTGTANLSGVTGRGNSSAPGHGRDIGLFLGNASLRVIFRSSVLGSTGLVASKTGAGSFDYGDLNIGVGGSMAVSGGTNLNLGNLQLADPLFVTDPNSTAVQSSSPVRAAAQPTWPLNSERAPVGYSGRWFRISSNGLTSMGAHPD